MGGWARAINEFAFHPQQQFAYTTGKNATDSVMIIDAMDLLHSARLRRRNARRAAGIPAAGCRKAHAYLEAAAG